MALPLRAGVAAILFLVACNPTARTPTQPSIERKIHATVVTIQTTIQPANKTYTHTIVIANDRARSGDEVDQWRLFEFAQKRGAFIEDVAKTVRIIPFADVIAARHAALARAVPDGLPRAQFAVTGAEKTL